MRNTLAKIIVPALLLPSCMAYGGKADYRIFRLVEKKGASISSTFVQFVEEDPRLSQGIETIYNATPTAFPSSLGAELYRIEYWNETYLVHKDKVYLLGGGHAGQGAYEFALANIGGAYTLYFTFSYVQGLYTSSVGAFDFSSSSYKAIEYPLEQDFQGTVITRDMQFVLSEKNTLDLYRSQLTFEPGDPLVPDVLIQADIASIKLVNSGPIEIKPSKAEFLARFDYGMHVKDKATLLWSAYLPFFNPNDYGQEYLIAGDQINVFFLGEMIFLESYPGYVTGRYYIEDVDFELATVEQITVEEAKEKTIVEALGSYSHQVVNEDLSLVGLEDLLDEDIVYAAYSKKNPERVSGLYSYKPR